MLSIKMAIDYMQAYSWLLSETGSRQNQTSAAHHRLTKLSPRDK